MTIVLNRERRRLIMWRLRHGNAARLDPEARIVYVVGLMLADSTGRTTQSDVIAAAQDATVVAAAEELIRRALR